MGSKFVVREIFRIFVNDIKNSFDCQLGRAQSYSIFKKAPNKGLFLFASIALERRFIRSQICRKTFDCVS